MKDISTSSNRRIALYGGAFDPPHNGHISTVALLLNSEMIDEVWITPSGDRPDKPILTRATHRLAMIESAIRETFPKDNRVKVLDAHAAGKAGFATIHLLDYLKSIEHRAEFFVVIGSELLNDLPSWNESDRLMKEANFLVVPRPGAAREACATDFSVQWLENPFKTGVTISSSAVRSMLKGRKSCAGFISEGILQYCLTNRLY